MSEKQKRYVARRRLEVSNGQVFDGEAFPADGVHHSLLSLGWVSEGEGTTPADERTHDAFADHEIEKAAAPAKKVTKAPAAPTTATTTAPAKAAKKSGKKAPAASK